jgi:hypothetical protein
VLHPARVGRDLVHGGSVSCRVTRQQHIGRAFSPLWLGLVLFLGLRPRLI